MSWVKFFLGVGWDDGWGGGGADEGDDLVGYNEGGPNEFPCV